MAASTPPPRRCSSWAAPTSWPASILETAKPLEGKLDEIVRLAKSVDGLATSINASAGSINGTARGINGTAGTILNTARSINDGVAQINVNLDDTLRLANMIKTDTGNILTNARAADRNLDCIENGGLTGAGTVPGPGALLGGRDTHGSSHVLPVRRHAGDAPAPSR